ncbi:MAG: transglycosylase domain-containing protein [Actinomycetota bacterium]
MTQILLRIKLFATDLLHRLRRPTRREVLIALAVVPAAMVAYVLILIPFTPGIRDIRKAKQERPALVLSADGKELAVFKRSNREWVGLDEISPYVIDALIATEDHRFYLHHGIDWRRTAGAALNTFAGDRQGGSTLTQQLARNLYPEEIGRAPTLTRKLKEAITAFKIEALYTKSEILETYLNTVPFLYNAYGIEMAARTYFDKSADTLDLAESATLVGMLKGNSYYNPVINPDRALQRRNTVLAQMVKRDKLSPAKFETLKKRPLRLDFERQPEPLGPAPHFAQQLRRWLITWADRNDYNIYADGLVVRTTIDSRLQAMANQSVARQMSQLQAIADGAWMGNKELIRRFLQDTPEYRDALASGLVPDKAMKKLMADRAVMRRLLDQKARIEAGFLAIDPRNGQIRAWVGSRDYEKDAFDHVQQARRQPGSTFKPFVYGAALQQGMSPEDSFMDQAVEIKLAGGEVWRPTDSHEPSGRAMSLRDALAYSKNTVTAQVMEKVGPARVAKLARALGVRQSKLEPVPSLALGTSPVTLLEMVSAYGTIADRGGYIPPVFVTRIEDRDGKVLAEFAPVEPESALTPEIAYDLVDLMRGVVDRGTGVAIRNRFGIRGDVAGKTGTTQDNADGWFILMHPQLVAGAWVGFNDSRVTLRSDYWGQGAHSALPIVGEFFRQAMRSRVIDSRARFEPVDKSGILGRIGGWIADRFRSLFGSTPAPEPHPAPRSAPRPTERIEARDTPPTPEPLPTASLPEPLPTQQLPESKAMPTVVVPAAPSP